MHKTIETDDVLCIVNSVLRLFAAGFSANDNMDDATSGDCFEAGLELLTKWRDLIADGTPIELSELSDGVIDRLRALDLH